MELMDLLDDYIKLALDRLYENDIHLVFNQAASKKNNDEKHHAGERSIVFRFSHYLLEILEKDERFSLFDLDCEYNRNGFECKSLPSFSNGTMPDLIIHKRGQNDHNLLVIEFKTYWNPDTTTDCEKLNEYTDPKGKYRYERGYSIIVTANRQSVSGKVFPGGTRTHF